MKTQNIRLAQSTTADACQAVAEFHAAVAQPDMELVLFFCSSDYDLDVVAYEMGRLFTGVQVLGCTTAGEIGPAGYLQHSFSGASFPTGSCTAVSGVLERLSHFEIARGHDFASGLLQQLEAKAPQADPDNSFAMMLIDGLSIREEPVAHALQFALGHIASFGCSAGDDQKLDRTLVFYDDQFYPDSAVLVLINTSLPFKVFRTQHFIATEERLVVTEADTENRIVKEINGLPAAAEYARLLGVDVEDLNSMSFAASPVVVIIDGTDYVRSIQKANPDGSLTFFCAIEDGVVLRVSHGVDLMGNLKQTFESIQNEIGTPQIVIACDCILRKMEIIHSGLNDQVTETFLSNNVVGLNSYGEQFNGVHVNQTLTGIAIGTGDAADV